METQITKEQVIDYLGSLTVQEMAILIDDLQETWGIAMASQIQQAPPVEQKPEEEQTEFDVVLESYGDKKINVIKTIRQVISGLGLKEAKELVESAPVKIKEATGKEDADEIKAKLEEAGGTVTVK